MNLVLNNGQWYGLGFISAALLASPEPTLYEGTLYFVGLWLLFISSTPEISDKDDKH